MPGVFPGHRHSFCHWLQPNSAVVSTTAASINSGYLVSIRIRANWVVSSIKLHEPSQVLPSGNIVPFQNLQVLQICSIITPFPSVSTHSSRVECLAHLRRS